MEIENDEGWMRSEGELLAYSYDRWSRYPSNFTTQNSGFPQGSGGTSSGAQSSQSYYAPQGIEAGNLNNCPLTNDPNLFGNDTLGFSNLAWGATGTTAAPIVTNIGGVALSAGGTFQVPFKFSDGRTAWFDVVSSATPTAGTLVSIGGVTIASMANSSVQQALGSTNVLGITIDSEIVTLPISVSSGGVLTIGGFPFSATTVGQIACYGQIAGFNPNANLGFLDRVTILQNSSAYTFTAPGGTTPNGQLAPNGGHTYFYQAVIPLKVLHDFFRQLDFPIINVGFNFLFNLAQANGPTGAITYPPLMTSNNVNMITGGGDNTPYPTIYYGKSYKSSEACRLYYRVVKFSPADNARLVYYTHNSL